MESIPVMLYKKCIIVCWFINWIPSAEGKERQKKETDYSEDHSKSVNFNKQGNLLMMLALGYHKKSNLPTHPLVS